MVDDDRVPVAGRGAPALDLDAARDRIRPAVGLVGVLEGDARLALLLADDRDRDPDRRALPQPRAEVGVHAPRRRRSSGRSRPSSPRPEACRPAGSRGSTSGRRGIGKRTASSGRSPSSLRARACRGTRRGPHVSWFGYRHSQPFDQGVGIPPKRWTFIERHPATDVDQPGVHSGSGYCVLPRVRAARRGDGVESRELSCAPGPKSSLELVPVGQLADDLDLGQAGLLLDLPAEPVLEALVQRRRVRQAPA